MIAEKLYFISPGTFNNFTYSKRLHFELFKKNDYDVELFGKSMDPDYCDLKIYQDLLTFSFIDQNVKPGAKILEIGGGDSRILKHYRNEYECWNLDKLEGIGNGPTQIDSTGIKLIQDYIGNFNEELPDNYFDLIFSISTLEHIALDDFSFYENILKDINRLLVPGGYSLHTLDHCTDLLLGIEKEVWTNPIIPFFFENQKMINEFVPLVDAEEDPELFYMSEKYYNDTWKYTTGKTFAEFGKPFSYNFLWKKV